MAPGALRSSHLLQLDQSWGQDPAIRNVLAAETLSLGAGAPDRLLWRWGNPAVDTLLLLMSRFSGWW